MLRKGPRHWARKPCDLIPWSHVNLVVGSLLWAKVPPLTQRDSLAAVGEGQGVVCPAGFVANIAGIRVKAAGVSLVLPVGSISLI